jgi:hypothetical protein
MTLDGNTGYTDRGRPRRAVAIYDSAEWDRRDAHERALARKAELLAAERARMLVSAARELADEFGNVKVQDGYSARRVAISALKFTATGALAPDKDDDDVIMHDDEDDDRELVVPARTGTADIAAERELEAAFREAGAASVPPDLEDADEEDCKTATLYSLPTDSGAELADEFAYANEFPPATYWHNVRGEVWPEPEQDAAPVHSGSPAALCGPGADAVYPRMLTFGCGL